VEGELRDLRYLSRTYAQVQTLMPRINAETLKHEHSKQERKKACGADGVTKDEYGENLEANIADLLCRMKSFRYKPLPVRRVYIPKANGKKRPLGLPSYEDKLVQGVMAGMLSEIYEERFCDSSYGFRPGRSAHDVLRYIDRTIMRQKVNYVLEADIKGFFDNVDHEWLMKFLEHDIEDKNFLRYIVRFLKAGVMEEGNFAETDAGVPQGGSISPVLANVYLHYVVDMWFERVARTEIARGSCNMVRFADDVVMCFQYEEDMRKIHQALKDRLAKFGLELSDDKTECIRFGRFAGEQAGKFDFLGFTFVCGKTRQGKFTVIKVTSQKKLKLKRCKAKAWIRKNMHQPVAWIVKKLNQSLRGHYNYYGISHNIHRMQMFYRYVKRQLKYWLGRRSQKGHLSWVKFEKIMLYNPLLKPSITRGLW